MKKNVLSQLILMFFIPLLFIMVINQTAFALTYTKLTGGTLGARSQASNAYKAFDSNTGTEYYSDSSYNYPETEWLRYQSPSAKIVTKYKVIAGLIGSWILKGSNDASTWTTLHSGTTSQLGQDINIGNTTPYLYYKIEGLAQVAGIMQLPMEVPYPPYSILVDFPYYAWSVSELELWAQSPPVTPTLAAPATDTDGTYTISWGADPDATSYQLEENYNGGAWSTVYNSSGTSTTLTGRSPGTWNYRLKATNSLGSSAYSATITVLVAPLPPTPTGPTSPNYTGSYTISWNAITGASSYQLQENVNGGTWSTIYDGSSTSVSRTGRSAGTWNYRVRSYGVTYSAYCNTISVGVSGPSVPAITNMGSDTDGNYTISWNAATGATSYQLEESNNGGGWTTIYNSTGLSIARAGRSYGIWNYRVKASNPVASSGYSSTSVLVATVPPNTPTGPVTDFTGSYLISWGAVSGANSYQLQERYNGGAWNTVYDGSSTTVSVSGRNTAGTWSYQVRAFGVAYSDYSGVKNVVVSVPVPPGTPTVPSTNYSGTFTVSWSETTGAASYQLEENYNGGSWSTVYNNTGLSTTRSGRSPGTWYYRLKATNPVGPSPYSGIATVLVAPIPPNTPTGPTTDYTGSYTISWNAVSGANTYQLQERYNGGAWNTVYDGSSTTVSVSGRNTAGTWGYQVRAFGVAYSDYSGVKNVVVSVPATPGTPTVTGTVANGSYTVIWVAATGAATYQLEEKFNDGTWSQVYNDTGLSTTRSGRNPGTWYYRLKASNPIGSSLDYSDTLTVLVPPAIPVLTSTGIFSEGVYKVGVDGTYTVTRNSVTDASSYILQEKHFSSGEWTDVPDYNNTSKNFKNNWGQWHYQVKACGVICSDYSDEIIVDVPTPPPPKFPDNHPTIDYNGNYLLEWSTVDGAQSYQIEEKFGMNGSYVVLDLTPDISTSINITGRVIGTYYYKVKANPFTEYSAEISVVVTVPEVPEGLTGPIDAQYNTPFTLSWNPVTDASKYKLLKEHSNNGNWIEAGEYEGASASITESDPGIWKYRINACSDVGCSNYSTAVTVLVAPPVPGTPTGPTTNYTGAYNISWGTVSGASSYQLDEQSNTGSWNNIYDGPLTTVSVTNRTTAGTWKYRVRAYGVTYSNYSDTKSVVVSVPATPGTPTGPSTDADGSYTISWSAATGAVTYQLEENNGGTWNEVYNNTGLSRSRSGRSPGTWNYRLKASNPIGASGYSGTKTVLVAPPVPVLSVPADTQYAGSYTVSWNAVTGASTYQLQERVDSGSWSTIQNNTNTSITRTGRSTGTWGYRVRAYGVAYSSYSTIKTVVVSAPATPTALTGPSTDADGSYAISWASVTGATSYTLQESKDGGSYTQAYSGGNTAENLTGRTEGIYTYRVNACSAVGCSSYSSTTSVDVDIPQANAVYNFGYDDNGNMTDMDKP